MNKLKEKIHEWKENAPVAFITVLPFLLFTSLFLLVSLFCLLIRGDNSHADGSFIMELHTVFIWIQVVFLAGLFSFIEIFLCFMYCLKKRKLNLISPSIYGISVSFTYTLINVFIVYFICSSGLAGQLSMSDLFVSINIFLFSSLIVSLISYTVLQLVLFVLLKYVLNKKNETNDK